MAPALLGATIALSAAAAPADSSPACSETARRAGFETQEIRADDGPITFAAMMNRLDQARAVVIGEVHDRYEDHLLELEILCRLHARHPALALGVEFLQQPFQGAVDRYLKRAIDRDALLRDTQYYTRWRFDWRLYAPLLELARADGIPVIALNVPGEITRKVSQGGYAALDSSERRWLPAGIGRDDPAYRERIRAVYDHHPKNAQVTFDHFLDAQRLWDEGMAERAAAWLRAHPGAPLLVIAGAGHVDPLAIPARLARRAGVAVKTVLPFAAPGEGSLPRADFVVRLRRIELPPAGIMGVLIDERAGGVYVHALSDAGAARDAGLRAGDRIVSIDGRAVVSVTDVKLALLDRGPGYRVKVAIARPRAQGGPETLTFDFALRASP